MQKDGTYTHDKQKPEGYEDEMAVHQSYLTDMDTLVQGIEYLRKNGFPQDFLIDDKGLYIRGAEYRYRPADVRLLLHRRFEGKSDPSDMSVLYGLETSDGHRGIVVNAFGPYGNDTVSGFIKKVQTGSGGEGSQAASSSVMPLGNIVTHALLTTGMFSALSLLSGIHAIITR